MVAPYSPQLAQETVRFLRELIRLDTSNPPGNEIIAAEYIASVLHAEGIEPIVIETVPRRGNVIARIRGDGSAAPLLLYSHTDVVPVEREKWSVDPFGGELRDGFVYGRGALDMKGIVAMQLAVFIAVAREVAAGQLSLARDLILAATADEEADTNQGIGVLIQRNPELLQAEYALSEFGGHASWVGRQVLYPIQTAEKGNIWMRLIAVGRPGHASLPHEDNPVVVLARALDRLTRFHLPAKLSPTTRALINVLAEALGGAQGVALRAWAEMEALRDIPLRRLVNDPLLAAELHAATHTTIVPTGLRAGYKVNVIPSTAEAVLDCRTVPNTSVEETLAAIRAALSDLPGLQVEVDSVGEALEFPFNTPLFHAMCQVLRRHDPHAIPTPYMLAGGTDAKHVSRLGTICYGFSPLRFEQGENFFDLVHGHDERVAVSALSWGVQVLYELVREFCAKP